MSSLKAEYSVVELGLEIFSIENLLEPELCKHIIEVAESCAFQSGSLLPEFSNKDVQNGSCLQLNLQNDLQKGINDLLLGKMPLIQSALDKIYHVKFPYAEACSIVRSRPGDQHKLHIDNWLSYDRFQQVEQGIPTRDVSVIGYLSDDFEGGAEFFDRQNLKVIPKLGSAIVFPAYYTHPHRSLPVTRGTKYEWHTWLYR